MTENGNYYETDSKYGQGILLEEYQGTWSLISARRDVNDIIRKRWCYPQRKDKPLDKPVPWKLELGKTKAEALETLRYFGKLLQK